MSRTAMNSPACSSLAILIMAGLAATASAQQSPLGDGTGLQKNSPGLQVQGPGLQRTLQVPGTGTPAYGTYRDLAAEVRFRNAIVTGNAPGGQSFRGNAGYTDSLDFRGRLGSDDLYKYRRDSLYSGSAGLGIRGTDALQYQFALSTGNVTPLNTSTMSRGGTNSPTSLKNVTSGQADTSLVSGALRSSSTFTADRTLRPVFMGSRQPTAGNYERLVASSLTGLHYQPWEMPGTEPKEPEPAKAANSVPSNSVDLSVNRSVSAFDEAKKRLEKSLETPGAKPEPKVDENNPKPDSAAPDPLSAIDKRLAEIRSALAPHNDYKKSTNGKAPVKTDKNPDGTPLIKTDGQPDGRSDGQPSTSGKRSALDPITLKAIKDSGAKADTLLPLIKTDAPPDMFDRYMADGQKMLLDKQFFNAEERFALALNSRPGDLAAMVGRLHAQLGAGMRVSANMNLRRVIATHPEALGMTYGVALMGGQERVDALRAQLRTGLTDPRISRESGLLLAYLGRQCGAEGKADLDAGLKSLEDSLHAMPKDSPDADSEAKLLEILKAVWVDR